MNFDSFIECRRHFLSDAGENRERALFLANLDELSMLIAKRLAADSADKVWHIQPMFQSKVLAEKVFSAAAFRLKSAGLDVSNLLLDSPEICPDRAAEYGILVLAYDDEQQKMNVGLCNGERIQWWFHEKN